MADADEDEIPRSHPSNSNLTNDPSYDPEDETQDFRFLASLGSTGGALPKRGEKDFEPNPTRSQASALNASREAMHNALAVERIHPPRNPCIGQYLPHEKDWRNDVPTDIYGPGGRCVVVEKWRGTHNKTLGREDWRNWTWLLPEEALFLLERGSLDIRWPDGDVEMFPKDLRDGDEGGELPEVSDGHGSTENLLDGTQDTERDGDDDVNGRTTRSETIRASLHMGELPMSLQGAYASLIGKSGLSLERYTVYASLKRLGYVVHRAPTWDTEVYQPDNNATTCAGTTSTSIARSRPSTIPITAATHLINRITSWLFTPKARQHNPSHGPLVGPGIYRSYADIFRTLALIPSYTNTSSTNDSPTPLPTPPFQIHYHIFRPSTVFKKTDPPLPDFRLSVVNARTTSVPTLTQITTLLDSTPLDSLPKDKKMEMKLKHGTRNVMLAVVDCGLVSYLRMGDCVFGEVGKVYEEKTRRGGKGRGGYRGRGRGRGGGGGGRGGGPANTRG